MECYVWFRVGPVLARKHATNDLAWAQPWSPRMLPTVLHGPSAAPHSMLPMLLHGPSPGHPACYRWSCVGPALAPKRATYGIVWAHHWPQSMLRTVLHGPITGPQSVLRMILHGPSTGHPAYYRWSCVGQHWPQSVLRMFLHGPSAGPNACY